MANEKARDLLDKPHRGSLRRNRRERVSRSQRVNLGEIEG